MKSSIRPLLVTFSIMVWLALSTNASTALRAAPPRPINTTTIPWVSVLVELQEPSIVQTYTMLRAKANVQAAETSAATKAQLATIEQAQQRLLASLAQFHAQVLYRNQRVYNGIAIRVAADKLAELGQLPEVKAVHPLVAKRPDATQRTPLSGAPVLWQGSNGAGLTGKGTKIAIIDTGVDYLHTDLGGPGVGYNVNDTAKIGDIAGFPNTKVLNGYDFAGDLYDADAQDSTFQPVPTPDPDPMDCYAHGTHVAGIAAGSGVNNDGKAYPGPYNMATDLNNLRIPPGVAPEAQIYALKVFGCTGSSEIVDQGVEWAVDPNQDGDLSDHVDVINLSLGSPYGALDDPTTIACQNAAAAGIIVVASAGNSGDVTYVTGSPAIADDVISVAAANVGGGTGVETLPNFSARGPRRSDSALKPDLAAPGFHILSAALGTGSGSMVNSGTSMAAPHVAGALALLHQLHPNWSGAELKALVMNSANTQIRTNETITATLYSPARIGAGQLDLEKAQQVDSLAYNVEHPGLVSVSFGAPEVLTNSTALQNVRIANKSNQTAVYNASYASVTDMPGVTFQWPTQPITVPVQGFADVPIFFTADAAQLRHVRDQAQAAKQGSQPRHWLSEKTGYLLLWPAAGEFVANLASVAAPPLNTNTHGVATFHYGPQTRTLTYTLTISGVTPLTQTTLTLNRGPLNGNSVVAYILPTGDLSPGETHSGTVVLDPQDEALLRDGMLYVNLTEPAYPQGLLRGQITTTKPVLAVPLYAAPRPAAAMQAMTPHLDFGQQVKGSQLLSWQGTDLRGSNFPTDVVSLVSAVGLQWRSPDLPPANPITGTEGNRTDLYDEADIKYLGVTSNFAATKTTTNPAGSVEQSTIYFGVATYGNWSTPKEVRFDINIDTNGDGMNDFRLFNSDQLGYNSDSFSSDAFMTALQDLRSGLILPQVPLNGVSATTKDTAPYNTNVMLLPIAASALGLTAANPQFNYYVESYSIDRPQASNGSERYVDRSPSFHVDLAHSGLDLTNSEVAAPLYLDVVGEKMPVGFDLMAYTQSHLQGILLLHHHNITPLRTEVIAIDYAWPSAIYLPLVKR